MEIYLGIASFMYLLKKLNKRHFMPNNQSVSVSALKLGPPQMFSFNDIKDTDCGFIYTTTLALKDVFDEKELNKILSLCEKKHNKKINNLMHCSVANDPALKNNIPIDKDGMHFNCRHP